MTDFLIAPRPGTPELSSRRLRHGLAPAHRRSERRSRVRSRCSGAGKGILGSGPGKTFNFALAAGLSNVLRLMEVELVRRAQHRRAAILGKTGHYSIGTLACREVVSDDLEDAARGERR